MKVRGLNGQKIMSRFLFGKSTQCDGIRCKANMNIIFGRLTHRSGLADEAQVPEDTRIFQELEPSLLHHLVLACHLNIMSLPKILTALKMQISLG